MMIGQQKVAKTRIGNGYRLRAWEVSVSAITMAAAANDLLQPIDDSADID